ncbi:ImmA/IrrE family metallo-endopeptidase [Arcanobacterium phocae]|uniref:ImmA/IrrE family metallo-endopeptidase n=1 Tax=Arcanobacterium phocae TaxID=131112 RepID=UPI001C0EED7E|nr:ImmA/IrrE family metallo-endopeptidase [Arcanobacterium phocae]
MSIEELENFIEATGLFVTYLPGLQIPGCYVKSAKTIYLSCELHAKPTNAISVLAHEYAHHLLGHDGPQPACEEEHADRLAARLLISPTEYALAEKIHDGHIPAIADELGVTCWIVKAYQRCLRVS